MSNNGFRLPACAMGFLWALTAAFSGMAQERNGAVGFADAARLAVAASAELKNAAAQRALREGAWTLGLRSYLPQLTLSVSEDDRLSRAGPDSFLKNYTVGLDQLLWDGGRTGISRKLERAELSLLADELDRNAGEIAESALASYRGVLSLRSLVAIQEKTLESLETQQRILEQELKLGLVIPLEAAEGEGTLREAELELFSARLELEEAERRFAEFLGLETLPALAETVDIHRSAVIPGEREAVSAALGRNPDLAAARHRIIRRQAEVKQASLSWMPVIRASGSLTVNGQRYPLSRYSWSMGLTVQFSSPWLNASASGSAGWEPPFDRTARVQNSVTPLPDPATGIGSKQAQLALTLERNNYELALERLGRSVRLSIESIKLGEKRRVLAIESLERAAEKYRLHEVLLDLGRITRVDLMEARIEFAQKETAASDAAIALLETERELEKLLNLRPGMLAFFTRSEKTAEVFFD